MPTTPYTAKGERCPGAKLTSEQVQFILPRVPDQPQATLVAFARQFSPSEHYQEASSWSVVETHRPEETRIHWALKLTHTSSTFP